MAACFHFHAIMSTYTIRLGDWATLAQDASFIRFEVFVDEQKVPAEIELDEMDAVCLHAVAYETTVTPSAPVACCPTAISAAWPCAKPGAAPASAAPFCND